MCVALLMAELNALYKLVEEVPCLLGEKLSGELEVLENLSSFRELEHNIKVAKKLVKKIDILLIFYFPCSLSIDALR